MQTIDSKAREVPSIFTRPEMGDPGLGERMADALAVRYENARDWLHEKVPPGSAMVLLTVGLVGGALGACSIIGMDVMATVFFGVAAR